VTDTIDSDARTLARFFDVYDHLPRGGPGDPESTRRALDLIPDLPTRPQVLDIGCGPGRGSLELAALTGGRITAFDSGDIRSIDEKAADVVAAGFEIIGHFTLPSVAWWDHYYVPM
jgi:SAM-dependent methyltransferase